jgi:4-hydroxy-tetrahydrodipicolinate synthase
MFHQAEGIIPALVTPFTNDNQLNEQSLRSIVKRFLDAGVHGLFCLGSNGEFFTLTEKEKIRIAEIIVDEAAGKVPVYVGTGGTSTGEVIRLNEVMKEVGVSAVSVITPYFPKLSQPELVYHYQKIANAVDLPIILYNIPAQSGNDLVPATVATLSKEQNIIGMKDSSGSFDNILQYIEQTDESFSILAGTDSLILASLMAGGKGAISATANFLPEAVVGIYEKWKTGDVEGAELELRKLRKIRSVFKLGSIPAALKDSLNKIGLDVGQPRLPILPLSTAAELEITRMIESYIEEGILSSDVLYVKED